MSSFPVGMQQSAYIDIALANQSLGRDEAAVAAAEKTIKLDRHTSFALQASSILLEVEPKSPERTTKLVKLRATALKRGAVVVANNIGLELASEADNETEAASMLASVLDESRKGKDYYNEVRVVIRLAETAQREGRQLASFEKRNLMGAYQFLFNERLSTLFDRSHNALWKEFSTAGDTENLLTLFRRSSFYWRVQGEESKESTCLKSLAKAVGEAISRDVRAVSREVAYFLVRIGSISQSTNKPRLTGPINPP
jgi:hypothetical protein